MEFVRDILLSNPGGRLWVIAPVQDPLAVQALLNHLGHSGAPAPPGPAAIA